MTESDERPDSAKLAGRALRALRVQQPEPVSLAKPAPEPPDTPLPEPVAHTSEPEVGSSARKPADPAPRRADYLLIVSSVLVVLAVAFAVIGFVVHQRGTESAGATRAAGRDDALTAARIDIATLQTLDYKDVKAGLDKWLAVTTGSFHDDIAKSAKTDASAIAAAKRVTVGKVLAAAVTDLDLDKGTATVIASVETTKTPEGGTSSVDRNRYRATLERVGDAWKIVNLGLVEVALS